MIVKPKNLLHFLLTLPTEQACIDYLEQCRWNGNITSPYDSTAKVWKLSDGYYRCSRTKKRFNVKTGTVLKHTKIPLLDWLWSLYHFLSKKGISSCQLARNIDFTQTTTWNLLKDIRKNLDQSNFVKEKLKGVTEIDETLVGGENGNRHWDKKVPGCQGRSCIDKTPILGMLEKGGYLVTRVTSDTKLTTLEPIIYEHVKEGATVNTDDWYKKSKLGKRYNHQMVNHSAKPKQYVKKDANGGKITTNSIEGVWSPFFKVTINGTYHNNISDKYLQNYADEFTFRYNTRNYTERDRFELALSAILGKKITYKEFELSI